MRKFVLFAGVGFIVARFVFRLYEQREALREAHGVGEVSQILKPAVEELAHGV